MTTQREQRAVKRINGIFVNGKSTELRTLVASTAAIVRFSLILVFLLSGVVINTVHGQASLLTEDIIDDIPVKPGGDEKKAYSVTVVRDAYQRDQWYYVPNAPRLVERVIDGKRYPEFALVK